MRPLLIYGPKIQEQNLTELALEYARLSGIPVVLVRGAWNLFPNTEPLIIGSFGTKAGFYATQHADKVTAIGTHFNFSTLDEFVNADVLELVEDEEMKEFLAEKLAEAASERVNGKSPDYSEWLAEIKR